MEECAKKTRLPEILKYISGQKICRVLSSKSKFQNPYFSIFNACKHNAISVLGIKLYNK
jgi:hypothetical protein